jgi:hypothetical protein
VNKSHTVENRYDHLRLHTANNNNRTCVKVEKTKMKTSSITYCGLGEPSSIRRNSVFVQVSVAKVVVDDDGD